MSIDPYFDLNGATPVGISFGETNYPARAPFSPDERYPEYPFEGSIGTEPNAAYRGVREALRLMGLDADRFGTSAWNPLREIVRPGDNVVIKPNFVRDFRESDPEEGQCTITHGSVLRAVCDYVFIALEGRGRITIADASHNDADFGRIREIAGTAALQRFYHDVAKTELAVYDLRPEQAEKVDGVIVGHSKLPGDPAGYVKCNLGVNSAFYEINHLCHQLYGSEYDMSELHSHQHDDVHEYLISKTILNADCIIGMPKLKTHKKVGLTVNLKSLVGINGNKNWLPHHREGTPSQGGDQFAEDTFKRRFERVAVARFKRLFPLLGPLRPLLAGPIKSAGKGVFGDTNQDTIRSGNWYGNDTTWRMTHDLNRILAYADARGDFHERPVRRFLSVVDGIVAGEGNGPLDATRKPCGIVLAGLNPLTVDMACARLMGFDYKKIPLLARAFHEHPWPLSRIKSDGIMISSNHGDYEGQLSQLAGPGFSFRPHFGWKGHIELMLQETTVRS